MARRERGSEQGPRPRLCGEVYSSPAPAAAAVEKLHSAAKCPVCRDYFQAPVSIHCGHSFCRACVSQCWGESETNFSCPLCRGTAPHGSQRPNWQLGDLVEGVKPLQEPEGDRVLKKHRQPLKWFCEEDQTLVCGLCKRSRAHRTHRVVPIKKAAQKYKKPIQTQVQTWKEKIKDLRFRQSKERRKQKCLESTGAERQKNMLEIMQLLQFMKEDMELVIYVGERNFLMENVENMQNEYVAKLSAEISRLSELIDEMEGKCRQPASEFLQDIRSTLARCENEKVPQVVESPFRWKKFFLSMKSLNDCVRRIKDSLLSGTEKKWNQFLAKERENVGERVNVTLDPDTAHPQLVLSEDGKSVRWEDTWQDLPDNPERFDSWACVLGCEGFTSGRHCWEVEVGGGGVYVVGVARESVGRKGEISLSPEEGIWSVGQAGDQYWALTSPKKVILPLSWIPQRIWVSLDYEEGLVTFFDADNESLIFPYQRASFTGERVLPFFVCGESVQLTLPPSEMRV